MLNFLKKSVGAMTGMGSSNKNGMRRSVGETMGRAFKKPKPGNDIKSRIFNPGMRLNNSAKPTEKGMMPTPKGEAKGLFHKMMSRKTK